VEERTRLLEAKRASEAARRKAEDEPNRSRDLDQLGKREKATWNQIAAHIQKRQPKEYDKAVTADRPARSLKASRARSCIPDGSGETSSNARGQGKFSAPVE